MRYIPTAAAHVRRRRRTAPRRGDEASAVSGCAWCGNSILMLDSLSAGHYSCRAVRGEVSALTVSVEVSFGGMTCRTVMFRTVRARPYLSRTSFVSQSFSLAENAKNSSLVISIFAAESSAFAVISGGRHSASPSLFLRARLSGPPVRPQT